MKILTYSSFKISSDKICSLLTNVWWWFTRNIGINIIFIVVENRHCIFSPNRTLVFCWFVLHINKRYIHDLIYMTSAEALDIMQCRLKLSANVFTSSRTTDSSNTSTNQIVIERDGCSCKDNVKMNATIYGVFHLFCPKDFSQGFVFLQNIITIKTKNNVNVNASPSMQSHCINCTCRGGYKCTANVCAIKP